jgi:replicative DNA helicase
LTVPPGVGLDDHAAQDVAAEQCVLGGMLLSRDAILDVIEIIRPGDHYRPAHQIIHEAILGLYSRGEPADAITVASELSRRGELPRIGGALYLHTLIASVPSAANAGYYATIVAEHAAHRRVTEAGRRIVQLGETPGIAVADLHAQVLAAAWNVTEGRGGDTARPLAELVPAAMDEMEAVAGRAPGQGGVLTGFDDLDRLLHGLHGGQMIIIAARPAVGKSLMAADVARSCALQQGKSCLFFSLEMGALEVASRVISATARVNSHAMRGGYLEDADWDRIALHLPGMLAAPLWVDDTAMITAADIRARAHRHRQAHGLDLLIVDYLQLMSAGRGGQSRQLEVSEMSRQLKLLAKELDVPLVALSQLNRGPEQRQDKKPLLSDLRESGAIENDADVVILLHREDAYEKETPRAGEADFIVAKNRGGPTATITVAFQGHYSRFADMAPAGRTEP